MPERTLDTLPPSARELYENVYANAKSGLVKHDEEAASRIAWSAVERFYEKNRFGRWQHK